MTDGAPEIANGMSTGPAAAEEEGSARGLERAAESQPSEGNNGPSIDEAVVARHRDLASKLLFVPVAEDRKGVVLAITSAAAGEGVTTSAAATAVALAESTTRSVLVVDANLRHPALDRVFGIPEAPGLCQMLEEREAREAQAFGTEPNARPPVHSALHVTALPNLWVLPSGGRSSDPTRQLTSERAGLVMELLASRFDYVVIDCPPVLTSVDAAAVCRRATHVALVVMAGRTPREHVQKACEHLKETALIGVLFNGVVAP